MKRWLLGMGVVAATFFAASSAFAVGGVSMSWDRCTAEGAGSQNRTFACASNGGSNILVASFSMPGDLTSVSGTELVIDVLSTTDPLPAWWAMKDALTCRQTALGGNTTPNIADTVCVDWSQGQQSGGISAYNNEAGSINPGILTRHKRLKFVSAVDAFSLQDLTTGIQYFSCNITITNVKSVGTGSCAGCSDPVCLVYNSCNVTTPVSANNLFIGNADFSGSNICTWQGGVSPNCNAVPTRNTTWGAVKSLYR